MIPKLPTQDEVIRRVADLSKSGQSPQQIVVSLNAEYRHVPIKKRGTLVATAIKRILKEAGKK